MAQLALLVQLFAQGDFETAKIHIRKPLQSKLKQKYGRNCANEVADINFIFDSEYIRPLGGLSRFLLTICRLMCCIMSIIKHLVNFIYPCRYETHSCNYHYWVHQHIRQLLPCNVTQTLQGWITAIQSCMEHQPPPSESSRTHWPVSSCNSQPKESYVCCLLKLIHWLPVAQRVEFKLAAMTYKVHSTSQLVHRHCQAASLDP